MRGAGLGAALAVVVVLVGATPAAAQRADEVAAAEVLFNEGKKLASEGRFEEACPKLAESNRLDPGIGTMLYLADCYEKSGRSASAWGMFKEAEALAHKAQDGREAIARDRSAGLEPKLPKLTIAVPAASRVDGLVVQRDGHGVGPAQWGLELPIDPGTHAITASAPGRRAWSRSVVLAEAGRAEVAVPALEEERAAAAPAAAAAEADRGADGNAGDTQRLVGAVLGGLGVFGVAAGVGFGVAAKAKADDADAHCDGAACDAEGVPLRDDAKSLADVSTVAFIAGGVALAAGAALYFTAPRKRASRGASATAAGLRIRF